MYILKEIGNKPNFPYQEYICDSVADMENIKNANFGSECYIVETKETYIKNSSGEWKIKPSSNSGYNGSTENSDALLFTKQDLTNSQKKQAKNNIDIDMITKGSGESSLKIDGSYEGVDNAAEGAGSIALGGGVISKSDGASSEGILTTAGRITQAETTDTTVIASVIVPAATELGMAFSTQEEIQATITKLGGFGAHAEGMSTEALGTSAHSEGTNTHALANSTHAEGDSTYAKGEASHTEGYATEALGNQSHAEGSSTKAKGNSAHSEGKYTEATGRAAHAEGEYTTASGNLSHAEGGGDEKNGKTEASGWCSHAEGWITKAEGQFAHSEGYHTKAVGEASHASGKGTIATEDSQTVIGKYNSDITNSLFVIGNGDSDTKRSNAFWVQKDGTTSLHSVIDKKIRDAGIDGLTFKQLDSLDTSENAIFNLEGMYVVTKSLVANVYTLNEGNLEIRIVPGDILYSYKNSWETSDENSSWMEYDYYVDIFGVSRNISMFTDGGGWDGYVDIIDLKNPQIDLTFRPTSLTADPNTPKSFEWLLIDGKFDVGYYIFETNSTKMAKYTLGDVHTGANDDYLYIPNGSTMIVTSFSDGNITHYGCDISSPKGEKIKIELAGEIPYLTYIAEHYNDVEK